MRNKIAVSVTLAVLTACHGGGVAVSAAPPLATQKASRPIDKIQHVVIVIQENRSFNNLFYGFPGAKTATFGLDSKNEKIPLKPIGLATNYDLEHNSQGFIASCDGTGNIPGTHCRNDGFNLETAQCTQTGCHIPKYPEYAYVPHNESAPYWSMAKQYVLADQMYASNFDTSSYVSHQYMIAAQADDAMNYPYTNWGCPGGPHDLVPRVSENPPRGTPTPKPIQDCFDYKTVADELDEKDLTWAFYAANLGQTGSGKECGGSGLAPNYVESGIWSSFQAIKHICYGKDWNEDVFTPPQQFLTDVGNGQLRDVTWVTPYCKNSDHPGCDFDGGPSWVASVVNAVGESKFWDSTAIFVMWDDYGGFYDPEPPAYVDYDGLGMRIPLMVISPYALKGVVSHKHYEHGSILQFVEERFDLLPLANSDKRANSLDGCFNFTQAPRTFVPIQSKYSLRYFVNQSPDYRPPDTD
jgi:phospholipase C